MVSLFILLLAAIGAKLIGPYVVYRSIKTSLLSNELRDLALYSKSKGVSVVQFRSNLSTLHLDIVWHPWLYPLVYLES